MKNIICPIVIFISLVFISCNDDFLNEPPKDMYTSELVWSQPDLVEMVINNMYRGYGYAQCYLMQSSLVDETHMTDERGTFDFNNSRISTDYIPAWGMNHQGYQSWSTLYAHIRNCNMFFENMSKIPDGKAVDGITPVHRMKGEAYFWRAQYYFLLTNLYGGVPLIHNVFSLDQNYNIPRASYEECIKSIVQDLDSAANNLPVKYSISDQIGKVTKGAAMSLKSRVLLYAASDLHNPLKNGSITAGYAHPEYLGYTSGDVNARWTAAKDAAKAVMDLGIYSLYQPNPAKGKESDNYSKIFLEKETSEDIFVRYLSKNVVNESWSDFKGGVHNSPVGYSGSGCNTPLEDFVSKYEMRDGSKFDWTNPTHSANPYKNRDPRLDASVFHEASSWRKRPSGFMSSDPWDSIQVGTVGYISNNKYNYKTIAGTKTKVFGVDSYEGEGTYTGYYMKKFLDPSVSCEDFPAKVQINPWRYIRYAEVLLNYAEACIELGMDADAKNVIKLIRTRVGMPEFTETGEALKERYRNERAVELAFEDHRFYDVRRWMIGAQAYTGGYAVEVRYVVEKDAVITGYKKPDGSRWVAPTFKKVALESDRQRSWLDKAYFFPFETNEMLKDPEIKQNPGY